MRVNKLQCFSVRIKPSHSSEEKKCIPWYINIYAVVLGVLSYFLTYGRQQPDDWASLWIGGALAKDGKWAHLYDHHPEDFSRIVGPVWTQYAEDIPSPVPHPFVQSPFVAQFLSLFQPWMSFEISLIVLTILTGWGLVIFLASSYYLWFQKRIPFVLLIPASCALWISEPVQTTFFLGQTSILIFAAIAYFLAQSDRRPLLAGIAIALAALVKITPAVVVVLLLFFAKRRKAALYALGSSIILTAISMMTAGLSPYQDWWERLGNIRSSAIVTRASQSFSSMILHGRREYPFFATQIDNPPVETVLVPYVVGAILMILAGTVAYMRKKYRYQILTVSVICVSTAISGLVWFHYFSLIVIAIMGIYVLSPHKNIFVPLATMAAVFFYPPLSGVVGVGLEVRTVFIFPWGGLSAFLVLILLMLLSAYDGLFYVRRKASENTENTQTEKILNKNPKKEAQEEYKAR